MTMISRWPRLLFATLSVSASKSPTPAAYWDFNEGEGTVTTNKVATKFGAITLTGSPEWAPNASGSCGYNSAVTTLLASFSSTRPNTTGRSRRNN